MNSPILRMEMRWVRIVRERSLEGRIPSDRVLAMDRFGDAGEESAGWTASRSDFADIVEL